MKVIPRLKKVFNLIRTSKIKKMNLTIKLEL